MTGNDEWGRRFAAVMMPTYGMPEVTLSHGKGLEVSDVDGNVYMDFIAGIAVSALGHGHPALVNAVTEQVGKLAHSSNLFVHQPGVELAERLLELLGANGKVFFANSGAEANEAALKLAITHGKNTSRDYFVAAVDGFHGRTMGALALTGKQAIREPFEPFGIDVKFVPYGDAEAMREAVTPRCAAVFLEPVQGETGVAPPPPEYFPRVRQICDDTGALFVADEIQSGIGRTGTWFAHQHTEVVPDILTLAKGLGGGLPIGACIGVGVAGDLFGKGAHGSTFGGNPVSCAAALAVLRTIAEEGLLDATVALGEKLTTGIAGLQHPLVAEVRGPGLWKGIELNAEIAATVAAHLRGEGVLVNALRPHTIRIAPPLTVTSGHIDRFLSVLLAALDAAAAGKGSS